MTSFVYIWVLCFEVSTENNQIALVAVWNSHCLEINIYFRGSKISLMWTHQPQWKAVMQVSKFLCTTV